MLLCCCTQRLQREQSHTGHRIHNILLGSLGLKYKKCSKSVHNITDSEYTAKGLIPTAIS